MNRNWKSRYLGRLLVEDESHAGRCGQDFDSYGQKYIKTVDSFISCNDSRLSVLECGNNRSVTLEGESSNTIVALSFPETIAVSANGSGIKLYDYLTLAPKTWLSTKTVSQIILNSIRLACIEAKTRIKTWNLYDHGTKSEFHEFLWLHTHDIKIIRFYKDLLVSFDNYQCFFWDWNTKSCIKVLNLEVKNAIISKNFVNLSTFTGWQTFKVTNRQVSKVDLKTLTFSVGSDYQLLNDSQN